MAKGWLGVILIFAMLPFGWIVRRYQRKWFASMMLVTYVGIVVYGLLSGISAYLVIAGVFTALAWWELETGYRIHKNPPCCPSRIGTKRLI